TTRWSGPHEQLVVTAGVRGRRLLNARSLGGEGLPWPEDRMSHRAPWECLFAKEQRSRCLPGKKPRTDHEYFEILSLCILQAGLSWASVRRSWPRYRSAFLNFEIAKLAHVAPGALLRRPGALRNRKKVAALVANAQEFERFRADHSWRRQTMGCVLKGGRVATGPRTGSTKSAISSSHRATPRGGPAGPGRRRPGRVPEAAERGAAAIRGRKGNENPPLLSRGR